MPTGSARSADDLPGLPPAVSVGRARRPKYDQLKETLLAAIESASPGTPLPAERDLCERFAVSRTTVRQALQELESDGHILRHQGRGTFVARRKTSLALQMTSFNEDMRQRGMHPSSQLLSARQVPAATQIGSFLGLSATAKVLRIERLRLADDEPMAVAVTYLPARRVKGLAGLLHAEASVYALLSQTYGIVPTDAEETFESVAASAEHAELLKTEIGAPLTLLTRRSWDGDGIPVEYARSHYRGDRYRFITRLHRPQD
ncbi:MAG: GntR family transcriptional regulator [Sporichthyaceae bacterium]|nr:GntR family transcriptional regulator [Sporichthyaceae bacterium]